MMTRLELLRQTARRLCAAGIEDGTEEARYALSSFLGCGISEMLINGSAAADEAVCEKMNDAAARREAGEPLAYIIGERWFMGLRFAVDGRVLIPRQDTETLAEEALGLIAAHRIGSVLDMCTGSGCLAISLKKLAPRISVTAADISADALDVARKNAAQNEAKIDFVRSDLFGSVEGRFGLIVANPPYVSAEEYAGLMREVKDHEPALALLADHEGYAFYERLAAEAGDYLLPGGWIAMEIGAAQAARTAELFADAGYGGIRIIKDLAGRDRVVCAQAE